MLVKFSKQFSQKSPGNMKNDSDVVEVVNEFIYESRMILSYIRYRAKLGRSNNYREKD